MAEKAVATFEGQMTGLPKKPADPWSVAVALEVCRHIASQKTPSTFVMDHITDPGVVGAVLHAPPLLSGLDEATLQLVRDRAKHALHPEQVRSIAEVNTAIGNVDAGVEAAKRMVLERTSTRIDRDDVVRSNKDPISPAVQAAE